MVMDMNKKCWTIFAVIVGVMTAIGAAVAVVAYLNNSGKLNKLKLKATDYSYGEEFPDEELV